VRLSKFILNLESGGSDFKPSNGTCVDTAVITAHLVLEKGKQIDEIVFCDLPTVTFSKHESVELPYRYIGIKNDRSASIEPQLPPGMYELLKRDNESDLFSLNCR
jgi:ribosome biogenesis SPOUT family RNA methylase Rps3